MKSDPQLRQDIRTLQEEVLRLKAALIEAKNVPPVTVDRVVEKRVVQFHDKPETLAELARAKAQIEKLQARPARVETVDRVVKVEVPVDRVVYRDRPVERVVAVEKVVPVEKVVTVEKVVRVPVDNPVLAAEIAGLKAEIAILKRGGA